MDSVCALAQISGLSMYIGRRGLSLLPDLSPEERSGVGGQGKTEGPNRNHCTDP